MPSATVIVPCRNEAGFIGPFLADLREQARQVPGLEFIIADGMSDDDTRRLIAEQVSQLPGLRVIDNPRRHVSTGLNEAIRLAHGEFIIRMDVHTRYAPDYCRQCLEVALETGADNVGGAARTEASGYVARTIAAAYSSPFAVGGARFHFEDYEGEVDTVTYGCWKRTTLLEIGGFDENLVRNQDDELNFRLRRAGKRIWQSRRIRSWYRPRGNFRLLWRQYFQYGYWKVAVIRKHGAAASWRHYVPAAFVASGLVGLLGALFWSTMLFLFMLWVTLYATFVVTGSIVIAGRRGWTLLPLLPVALVCFHWGYGLGFLAGLLSRPGAPVAKAAAELSR